MKIISSFVLIYFFAGISVLAQKYAYQSFTTSQGLPQSQVNAICQDDNGYLWCGTLGGIARFNGSTFSTFSSDDGLLNNRVSCLSYIDKTLWVGHDGGVSRIVDSKITAISVREELKTIGVSDIIKFKNRILVAFNGGGLFFISGNKLIEIPGLKDDALFVRDLHLSNNTLYLGTRVGLIETTDLLHFHATTEQLNGSVSAIANYDNQLIISTFSEGLFYYSPESKKIYNHVLENRDARIFNFIVDNKNEIWMCTQVGIIRLKNNKEEYIDDSKGLPINAISCGFQDADHNCWFGTQGKGMIRAPRNDLAYFDKETGLKSDLVVSGFQDNLNNYYFGTFDIGVVKMSPGKNFESIPFQFNNTVWAAQKSVDNHHWFGTKASLFSLDKSGSATEYSIEDGLPGYKITCLHKVSATEMYVGGKDGVVLYSKGKFIEVANNRSEIGTARSILVVNKVLFVGTDLGLFQLKNRHFIPVSGFVNTVFCLAKDQNNNLLFGTEDGLYSYANNKINRIRFASELSANYINFLNYKSGTFYVGTNNGLYLLKGDNWLKNPTVSQIGISDGLIDLETNLNSSFFDNQGYFWFGTSAGLVKFNPDKFTTYHPIRRIKLKEILLNFEPFDYLKYSSKLDSNSLPSNLVLSSNDNNLLFHFDGISVSGYQNINFQYWLEGLETGWSPATKNTSVSFSGLAPGDYILRGRILDANGISQDEVRFLFTVLPPFYKRWWFISLLTLLVGGVVLSVFRFRIKRAMEISENERMMFKARLASLEQQSLNASMNRHFIFNSLNSIQYFINTSDKLSANKYLTNFAKLIRKNLDSSSENNNLITLAQEIDRIQLYLSLEAMRFKDKFDYSIETNDVDLDSITIPSMIIQPFVENSIIHGVLSNEEKKGQISIRIRLEDEVLTIEIEDNGIGIDNSLASKVGFEGDHKSQGMEITLKRIDLLKKVSNQNLELKGPFQVFNEDGTVKGTLVVLKITLEN